MGGPVASAVLVAPSREYWEARMINDPLFATAVGDRRYDDKLSDVTPAGRAQADKRYESILQRATEISETSLSPAEKLTKIALLVDLQEWCYRFC